MTHVAQLPDSAKTGTTRRASFSPKNSTNPYIGIAGVFLGAGLATLNGRLVSVGLPDLRRALILGFDEASWLPAALNMATMFAGCFVVFLSAIYGVRRILLPAAGVFALTSFLLPLAPGYWRMLALIVIAGLTSGTFYSLTLTFVLNALPKRLIIFGMAAYAADIVFVSNFASSVEGWYVEHLSWHWIFWNASAFAPIIDDLRLFWNPTAAFEQSASALAWLCVFQARIRSSLWSTRSRPTPGLAEFRRNCGDDSWGGVAGGSFIGEARHSAEYYGQALIPQQPQHRHSRLRYCRFQIYTAGNSGPGPGLPCKPSAVLTARNEACAGLGGIANVRGCLACRHACHLYRFEAGGGDGPRNRRGCLLAVRKR